jgi:asparagine synthase (glutamine-hydrolysing)
VCAIAGLYHKGEVAHAEILAGTMADAMAHRGPDDRGTWACADAAFGFRRLAIVDLADGRQPMANEDGSVVVVFNGEIYNHVDLRRELERCGHRFATDHSDTEVLVHGFEQWGLDMLPKLNGMYAFAILDTRERALILARDRLGIKPLYVAEANGILLFASEIRGLAASGLLTLEPEPCGILEYLTLMNNWRGRTPFRGVSMLAPGTWRRVTPDRSEHNRFWSMSFPRRRRTNTADLAAEARHLLTSVLERQTAADVRVAAYLSGGIDSTAIAVGMHGIAPTTTCYSCIFDLDGVGEDRFVDEREFSRGVAERLGLDRVEYLIGQDDLANTLDATVTALEYPRMGMAYVNYLIAGRVTEDAKVVLSGMGGDEFMGGYVGRYAQVPRAPIALGWLGRLRNLARRPSVQPDDALAMFRRTLHVPLTQMEAEVAFTPEFRRAAAGFDAGDEIDALLAEAPSDDPWDRVMYADAVAYLHGLLILEDKLSMIHSLETRVPLLDQEWIDFTLDIPWGQFCDGETGKILFRETVRPWVPDAVYRKPKMGFGPPDASWYRGRLRTFITTRLSPERVAARGILDPVFVSRVLDEHMSGRRNAVALIWCLLCLDSWCETTGFFGGRLSGRNLQSQPAM